MERHDSTTRRLLADPRHFQIAVLGSLALYGLIALDFEIRPARAALLIGTALATQALLSRWVGLPRFEPRSALISSLSLILLLRTASPLLAAAAAVVAIGSKFALRSRGRHLFNPTCFGLVVFLLATDRVWVSPGQWGAPALGAFAVAGLGSLVIRRATRSDVTWAFLGTYLALLAGRALWLGDPWTIPLHQAQSGALLLFAFFMISDPMTTPDSRPGRILFGIAVAGGGFVLRFVHQESDGLLYALAAGALLVPLLNRLLPGAAPAWPTPRRRSGAGLRTLRLAPQPGGNPTMHRLFTTILALGLAALCAAPAQAFCGFYVGRADSRLYNQASQVVLVRDGDRTVVTMASDYRGELNEFALIVPVPVKLEREQIHVTEMKIVDHLDAFTAPRLVEYFDGNPCAFHDQELRSLGYTANAPLPESARMRQEAEDLGVTIEASYAVGEYDILILAAEESRGLLSWLRRSGYRVPEGSERVVGSYLRQGMRFFVAKVNLEEQARRGTQRLRPLQIAYESPKFMLPIRLGTVNADGAQDLLVYALTRTGRVETTNYRTVRLPTDLEVPVFVKDDFGRFYQDLFARQSEREGTAVFLEYAWDMGWCDPCAADPLSPDELRELGVFWIDPARERRAAPQAQNVFVSRLHVRYDQRGFPEDLMFQETGDRTNFQGRYVLRHAFTGPATCREATTYRRQLAERQEREAQTLASLTGWDLKDIRRRAGIATAGGEPKGDEPWWKRLWRGF